MLKLESVRKEKSKEYWGVKNVYQMNGKAKIGDSLININADILTVNLLAY